METSNITIATPKLDGIDIETLNYVSANLVAIRNPQSPTQAEFENTFSLLFDIMDSLVFQYGEKAAQRLLLEYFSNHKTAFYAIDPEELRVDLFGAAHIA